MLKAIVDTELIQVLLSSVITSYSVLALDANHAVLPSARFDSTKNKQNALFIILDIQHYGNSSCHKIA